MIVLHAPPDKEIQTIDEILDYAIKPGTLHVASAITLANIPGRVPDILHCGRSLCCGYDLQSCAYLWKEESADLLVDLLNRWICVRYVSEGYWYRG